MSSVATSDRNLLFGILALQRGFIRDRDLIAALHAWALVPAHSLGNLLLERRALTPAQHDEIAHLVAVRGDPGFDSCLPTRAPSLPAPSVPSVARFRPQELHARGGLGEVLVAIDCELDRKVALKQIQQHWADDPACRARFLREARITARLEHPGIVPIYGLGRHPDGRPFYAMRLIQGETLREAIHRYHQRHRGGADPTGCLLQLRDLAARFVSVCQTMAYAHSRGVVHRDPKPSNVMLGPYGETLVVDWGLARVLDEADDSVAGAAGAMALTMRGTPVGTPAYMAPEQAAGRLELIDARTDVYLLGGMLYELLTDQPPHPEGDPSRPVRLPHQIAPDTPTALETVAMMALRPRREDRPGSALALAEAVQRWLAGGTPVAEGANPAPWLSTVAPGSSLPSATLLPLCGEGGDVLVGAYVEEEHSQAPAWPADSTSVYPPTPSRYSMWQELAQGGTGQLYLCHDEDLNRLVVIKELRESLADNPHARRWLLREAQITAQLEHPGIRGVHGVGKHPDGRPFLVLRYVRGRDMRQAIREFHEHHPLPSIALLELAGLLAAFGQVCRTLEHAHGRGVVHGDPKPANILLGTEGEVLVADWGLARLLPVGTSRYERVRLAEWAEPEGSLEGEILGTPGYLAPEAAWGKAEAIDPRTDVFALGATLFHLLAGRPPWGEGGSREETLERARTTAPPRLGETASWVPEDLARACDRAMARSREERYASAGELAAVLERWVGR